MVLTVEEKLNRLHNMDDWEIFPPEQAAFLEAIANNTEPAVAMHQVRPDIPLTGRGSVAFHASRMLTYTRIKKALDVIQYVKPEVVYTKKEALEDITYRLRKQNLEDETYIKLLGLLAKMNGWDKPKEKPEEVDPEEKINQMVADLEKKRKDEA